MSLHQPNRTVPPTRQRRAVALIIAVLLLGVTNLLVTGMIAASGDDAYIGKLRLDSIRSEYAAESAIIAALKQFQTDTATPLTGTLTFPGGATATIVDPFDASPLPPGVVIVEGASGQAKRRMSVTIQ
jgi:Tfp pilus assembly protein PilX